MTSDAEDFAWSEPFPDFVDPRPRSSFTGSIRTVSRHEAMAEQLQHADLESWYDD